MAMPAKNLLTPEEYLVQEREADGKSEYLAGQVFAMARASERHDLIAGNVFALLWARLRGAPCHPFTSDMRVQAGLFFTYPDVTVVCGERRFADAEVDTLLNPVLIVEVLSPSTEAFDRGEKFARYQQIAALQEYALISQTRPRVESYLRQPDGTWSYRSCEGLEAALPLESVGISLAFADIYEGILFDDTPLTRESAS